MGAISLQRFPCDVKINGVIILAGHDVQAPAHDHAGRAHVRAQRDALLRGHLDDLEHHHHGAHVPGVVEEPAERHAGRHGGRKPRRGDRGQRCLELVLKIRVTRAVFFERSSHARALASRPRDRAARARRD